MKIKLRKFNAEDAYLLKKYQFHQMDMNEITDMIALWNKNLYNGRYCEVFAAEYEGPFRLVQHGGTSKRQDKHRPNCI